MSSKITYEQPLNERIRTFLRLEYLFAELDHYISAPTEWDSRNVISTLLNIIDFLTRSDIKSEIIKELERHATTLATLETSPAVDNQRLHIILDEINNNLALLRDSAYQPGQSLRENEFIMSIKQRSSIPGGSCNFDLPGYHHWLHKPFSERNRQLEEWQIDLFAIKRGMDLSLQMIRNSTNTSFEKAERGFYQRPIESNTACQMIRVVLPDNSKYFPEISGGRHRFTIRFMEQLSNSERPLQSADTVEFELHCCIL